MSRDFAIPAVSFCFTRENPVREFRPLVSRKARLSTLQFGGYMDSECPIHGAEGCTEFNTHHLFWTRRSYKSQLEKTFRALHTIRICVDWHKHLHATTNPPKKPSAREMRSAIEVKKAGRRDGS